jgi:precorrin-3B synthase
MPSGDGALLRLSPPREGYRAADLRRIADLADRFGNGAIEITARLNLQLRGFEATEMAEVAAHLAAGGVGEWLRDPPLPLIASPFSAEDPRAADVGRIARAIEDGAGAPLAAKFAIVVSGGGVFGLAALPADLRVDALPDGRWRVAVMGDAAGATPVAYGKAHEAASAARRLLAAAGRLFPARRPSGGAARDAWCAAAGREPIAGPGVAVHDKPLRVEAARAGGAFVRLAPEFGRLSAASFAALAAAMPEGARALAAPRRALVVHCPDAATAVSFAGLDGFIADPADPRLAIEVCTGAPGCASGHAPTLADARALAARLSRPAAIHVSGCAKGCAAPRRAAHVFVATADGYRYARNATALEALAGAPVADGAAMARLVEGEP